MVDYLVTESELTQLANTIRAHCGEFMPLMYPFEYITKIKNTELGNYGDYGDLQGSSASRTTLNAGFQANASITFVSFPLVSSITSSRAFRGCPQLKDASFQILSSIPILTFATCSQLQSVSFPACETIDYGAFFYCIDLKKADFPNCTTIMSVSSTLGFSVSSNTYFPIGYASSYSAGAFQRTGIIEANFPVCTSIGDGAYNGFASTYHAGTFAFCSSLTKAFFPKCLYIGSYAFYKCTSLTNVSFSLCAHIAEYAFTNCNLSEVIFPACESVARNAFYSCSALTTVSLPALTSIGAAFVGCVSLMSLYLLGSSMATMQGSFAFTSTPMQYSSYTGTYGSIYVPASLLTAYKTATNWVYYSSRFVGLTDEEIAALPY